MSTLPSRSNPLAGRHQLAASAERSANQVTNQVKALLLNILALEDSGFPEVSSPRLKKDGMRDYCEATAHLIDEFFLAKENCDQIILYKTTSD